LSISVHLTVFAGKPVRDWEPDDPIDPAITYRLSITYEEAQDKSTWTDKFAAYLNTPNAAQTTGLIIGAWWSFGAGEQNVDIIPALVAARDRLPALKALFIGEITYEESEISWIRQSDLSPILEAYPALEHFQIRGSERLSLGSLDHAALKTLILESGGLPRGVVSEVMRAKLPALEHLELWLGVENYGGDAEVGDLYPILNNTALFPKLRYLGLRDSEIADEIAAAVAIAPVLSHIRVLDLSLGVLSDVGGQALLDSPAIAKLDLLDLHHHFFSAELMEKFKALPITVDLSEAEGLRATRFPGDDGRFVAVSE
jgi:hypothetical protein